MPLSQVWCTWVHFLFFETYVVFTLVWYHLEQKNTIYNFLLLYNAAQYIFLSEFIFIVPLLRKGSYIVQKINSDFKFICLKPIGWLGADVKPLVLWRYFCDLPWSHAINSFVHWFAGLFIHSLNMYSPPFLTQTLYIIEIHSTIYQGDKAQECKKLK